MTLILIGVVNVLLTIRPVRSLSEVGFFLSNLFRQSAPELYCSRSSPCRPNDGSADSPDIHLAASLCLKGYSYLVHLLVRAAPSPFPAAGAEAGCHVGGRDGNTPLIAQY